MTTRAIMEGKTIDHFTIDMVKEASLEGIGRELGISEEGLKLAIDPMNNVRRREVVGGPAPEEVMRMIDDRHVKFNTYESRHKKRQEKLEMTNKRLEQAMKF
jgi:argininosuccinate lyase